MVSGSATVQHMLCITYITLEILQALFTSFKMFLDLFNLSYETIILLFLLKKIGTRQKYRIHIFTKEVILKAIK